MLARISISPGSWEITVSVDERALKPVWLEK